MKNFKQGKYSMKKLLKMLFVSMLLLTEFNCNNNPVTQTDEKGGRRDYTWTIDTIKTADPLTLSRIWGITPNDIWAVGNGAATAVQIWHYDGKSWKCDNTARPFTPWAVIGFSSNEVWIGNTGSTIWKYNGTQWQQYGKYNVEGYDQIWIMNFDGTSSKNIYGVGSANKNDGSDYKGTIMHYDGQKWSLENIPSVKVGFADGKIDQKSGALITEGTVYDSTGWINKVHSWDGKQLKEIYSGIPYAGVGSFQHEVLVSIDHKIYKYSNGQLVLWKDLSGTEYYGKIWCGRSENDFFLGSLSGGVDIITELAFKQYLNSKAS